MQEIIAQTLDYLKSAWRYRWLAVAVAWVVAVVGWIVVMTMPNRYESSTTVYVDTESLLKPLLEGVAVEQDVTSQVAMMQAVMLSRPNLEKVATKNDLLLGARTAKEREEAIVSLEKRITLEKSSTTRGRRQGTNVFVVKYLDDDAKVSHRVVQTLLDTFMEDSLGLKRTDAGVAQRFLESQVKDYEQKLYETEQRLAAFKKRNVGLMPGAEGDYFSRLEDESNKLQQLRAREGQLVQRRAELQKQLSAESPTLTGSADSGFDPIDAQIAKNQAALDDLLLKYTDKHPQVITLKENIARLEKEKESGARSASASAALGADLSASDKILARSLEQNPVYQSLRMALSQLDADLAQLRGEITGQDRINADLRDRIDAIPEVEAELARLNRDYKINKTQYDTLLQRLESARISEQAEQNTENVKFRVIEPPTVPYIPTWPNRVALNTLVLLGALGAGVALAILLSQLHPTIPSREVLKRVTGLRVLGAISVAMRESVLPWYRRQPVLVASAVGLLVAVYLLNVILAGPMRQALRAVVG
jgi:polysaccharide chain length determinant protein (PEP-CTERM system associated)